MTKKMRAFLIIFSVILLIITLVVARGFWENEAVQLNKIKVKSKNLPSSFSGFKIAHISDLHNAEIGDGNYKVLQLIKEASPDIIAITGDIVDSKRTNFEIAVEFCKQAVKIAPTYYTPGNHESRLDNYSELVLAFKSIGVCVLENDSKIIEKSNQIIKIVGLKDCAFLGSETTDVYIDYYSQTIDKLCSPSGEFQLVLSHRPEFFNVYKDKSLDLVLSGHAHGGQFILPLIGGLFAPGQGFFPKYTQGLFTEENTNMVVSRGVGNSAFPFRLNNRPEVVLIELA